jgi:hypothetical protein
MFIHVSKNYAVALEESADFKHFKLVIDVPRGDAKLAAALDGVATIDRDGHSWVSEAWLRQREPGAPWQDGLTAMFGVAKKYGWVDEPKKAIRAHIEWASETAKA